MCEKRKPVAVAIDGPSGAGKSTMARLLGKELGLVYMDTGALYRAVGYAVLSRGEDPSDEAAVEALLPSLSVSLRYEEGEQRVFVGDTDVTPFIRTPAVSMAASAVSAMPKVREALFSLQRDFAKTHSVIMDGRDIGTVVLPQAQVKIFLTASVRDRAQRRYEELRQKGEDVSFDRVLSEMIERDERDERRAAAPLRAAGDAVLVDTSGNTLEQSVALLRGIVEERLT